MWEHLAEKSLVSTPTNFLKELDEPNPICLCIGPFASTTPAQRTQTDRVTTIGLAPEIPEDLYFLIKKVSDHSTCKYLQEANPR
jgi:hypothetical protein